MKKFKVAYQWLVMVVWAVLTTQSPALAGPGHDHGDAPTTAVSGAFPQRQPDGSVVMPKAAQRQLRIQTLVVKKEQRSPVIEHQ